MGAWCLTVVWKLENNLKASVLSFLHVGRVCVELGSPEFVGRMLLPLLVLNQEFLTLELRWSVR